MKKLLLILLSIILLTGCGTTGGEIIDNTGNSGFRRIIDEEAGVVCWYMRVEGGIDCLPIEQTRLKAAK